MTPELALEVARAEIAWLREALQTMRNCAEERSLCGDCGPSGRYWKARFIRVGRVA